MRTRTAARLACTALVVGSLGALVPQGIGVAATAPPAATWHLVGHNQKACFDSNVHDAWFGVFVKGTWTHPLQVGMSKLPTSSTYATSYAPVAPGSSGGKYTLAYGDARLASSTPVGTYSAVLWASDGTTRSRVRVELDVKASCGY